MSSIAGGANESLVSAKGGDGGAETGGDGGGVLPRDARPPAAALAAVMLGLEVRPLASERSEEASAGGMLLLVRRG